MPTARTLAVARPPCVVKADGLAAGKGVWVCRTNDELDAGLRAAKTFGQPFQVEELLEGPEVSLFALCDGTTRCRCRAAQDYKRIGDGDEGPNTGGMGAYSPVPGLGRRASAGSSTSSAVPCSRSSPGAGRRSPACSSPA